MDDALLTGGNMGEVRRIDAGVERPAGAWTPSVHRLLRDLAAADVDGVPVPRGVSADGTRETVSFVPGDVPAYPMPRWVWEERALVSATRLLRRVHDASVDADRAGPWRAPVREPAEVICHGDFAPYNLVFRGGVAVGAIDWDFAAPGPRLWDLAYLAYRIVPLTTEDVGDGFGEAQRRGRIEVLLDAYGTDATPAALLRVVVDRLLALAEFSNEAAVAMGNPDLTSHAQLYRRDAAALEVHNER